MVLLKWLILGAAVWLLYRLYIAPRALGGRADNEQPRMQDGPQADEGDYVDYEEVD